jgi:hypothetical protein
VRLRLFPVLIVVAAASLAVKTGDIWQGVGALAQESTPTAETVPAEVKAEVSEGAAAPATMTPAPSRSRRRSPRCRATPSP